MNLFETSVDEKRIERSLDLVIEDVEKKTNTIISRVKSSNGEKNYTVEVNLSGEVTCNCPDFKHRSLVCKHIIKVISENIPSLIVPFIEYPEH